MTEEKAISEAASEKKKRGRPENGAKPDLTRRQQLERRWALEGVGLLMDENGIPEEFHWLCDDDRVFKVGVLAQLGRIGDRETAAPGRASPRLEACYVGPSFTCSRRTATRR